MNQQRTTWLLLILIAVSAITMLVSSNLAARARVAAVSAAADLSQVESDLSHISSAGSRSSTGDDKAFDLNAEIRAAAEQAGAGSQLSSIEPSRSDESGQSTVLLRFDAIPLAPLAAFIERLSARESWMRVESVECSAVDQKNDEQWATTVTLTVRMPPAISARGRT